MYLRCASLSTMISSFSDNKSQGVTTRQFCIAPTLCSCLAWPHHWSFVFCSAHGCGPKKTIIQLSTWSNTTLTSPPPEPQRPPKLLPNPHISPKPPPTPPHPLKPHLECHCRPQPLCCLQAPSPTPTSPPSPLPSPTSPHNARWTER